MGLALSSAVQECLAGTRGPTPREIDYSDEEEIYRMIRPPSDGGLVRVKLLRGDWLLERAAKLRAAKSDEERAKLALPCRQELEKAEPRAYYTAEEMEFWVPVTIMDTAADLHALSLTCVSYCWETPTHPDPLGKMLIKLADALTDLQNQSEIYPYQHRVNLPPRFAVFIDWAALPQKPGGRERTAAEAEAFSDALASMQVLRAAPASRPVQNHRVPQPVHPSHGHPTQVWYAHMLTTCVLMTAPIEDSDSLPYDARGWPNFERLVSMIATPNTPCVATWPQIVDVGARTGPASHRCKRIPPLTVTQFRALMRSKTFTNGSDCELVIDLYRQTLESVLKSAPELHMRDNEDWGDAEMISVVSILPLCVEARRLNFYYSFRYLKDDGLNALTAAIKAGKVPPSVKKICFHSQESWRYHRKDLRYDLSHTAAAAFEAACNKKGIELATDEYILRGNLEDHDVDGWDSDGDSDGWDPSYEYVQGKWRRPQRS